MIMKDSMAITFHGQYVKIIGYFYHSIIVKNVTVHQQTLNFQISFSGSRCQKTSSISLPIDACFPGTLKSSLQVSISSTFFRAHFSYEHVAREKLPKRRSHEKFVRKMLMKLTVEVEREHIARLSSRVIVEKPVWCRVRLHRRNHQHAR
jgi:hypothetical protein